MQRPQNTDHISKHITWQKGEIDQADREQINMHKGAIVWLTGLSGAGKSSIGIELERRLFHTRIRTYRLDGDNLRFGLSSDLGFTPEDRDENIRRVGEVAKLFADAGLVCITCFISPYKHERQRVRKSVAREGDFIEVHVHCPLEVCEQRDVRGLYKKARAGEISDFTGISAPYEEPEHPEIMVDTSKLSLDKCVTIIFDYLRNHGYLGTAIE